jgi:hypothetical protein
MSMSVIDPSIKVLYADAARVFQEQDSGGATACSTTCAENRRAIVESSPAHTAVRLYAMHDAPSQQPARCPAVPVPAGTHVQGPQPAGAEQARTGRAAPAAKLGSFPFGARPHLALNNPIPTPVQTYLLSATVTRVCLAPAPCPIMHPFALVGHSAAALDRS